MALLVAGCSSAETLTPASQDVGGETASDVAAEISAPDTAVSEVSTDVGAETAADTGPAVCPLGLPMPSPGGSDTCVSYGRNGGDWCVKSGCTDNVYLYKCATGSPSMVAGWSACRPGVGDLAGTFCCTEENCTIDETPEMIGPCKLAFPGRPAPQVWTCPTGGSTTNLPTSAVKLKSDPAGFDVYCG